MKLFFTISLLAAISQLAVAFPSPPEQSEPQNGERPFVANPEERGGYFEGDMVINEDQLDELRSGLIEERRRWPNKTLVYKLMSTNWTSQELVKIKQGVDLISSKTCIKFRRITRTQGEEHYVAVYNRPDGCWSQVGVKFFDTPAQEMNLEGGDDGCFSNGGTVAHEFIHALGFFHEQSRTDRNDWVTINWQNIDTKENEGNFKKYEADYVTDFKIKYDYGSVMHYGRDFFGKIKNGRAAETITPKTKGVEIGQRRGLSSSDFAKLNAMYKC